MDRIVLILALLFISGCSYFEEKPEDIEEMSAAELFKQARDNLKTEYYSKAIEYYEKLQARYPFGPDSAQAQVDLAYCYYKNDAPDSARAAAERFIKLYPSDKHIDYAYYLKGLSNFNQGKGFTERYLPIDSSQRDPGASLKSFQDFSELIKRYPKSKYVEDAKQRMVFLRNLLAQHEINVAQYYLRRRAYIAAANRARYVVENYQGSPAMPEALSLMAKAYKILEMNDLANDALRVLQLNYPQYVGIAEVRETVVTD